MKLSSADRVHQEIRNRILRGELAAGVPLRAATLSRKYGWGLTPIREALTRLQAERLVQMTHNSGFAVTAMTDEGLADLSQSRLLVETEMLRASMANGSEEWEGRIVAAFFQFQRIPTPTRITTTDEFTEWERRHSAFHAALLSGCSSDWLRHLNAQMGAHLLMYQRNIMNQLCEIAANMPEIGARLDGLLADAMGPQDHETLMQSVLDRDDELATANLASHARQSQTCYSEMQEMLANAPVTAKATP